MATTESNTVFISYEDGTRCTRCGQLFWQQGGSTGCWDGDKYTNHDFQSEKAELKKRLAQYEQTYGVIR